MRLNGSAEFHGTVSGSLLVPDVKGHLTANNFDTVFGNAAPAGRRCCYAGSERASCSGDSAETARRRRLGDNSDRAYSPAASLDGERLHWDSLDAQAEYSPDGITVQQATLVRGKSTIHVSGSLHAHQTSRHHKAFDDESALNATVSVQNAPVTDLLTMPAPSCR